MDAVKYLEEKKRMLKALEPAPNDVMENTDPINSVELVSMWSAENPIKTRADVFKEMFPNSNPLSICKFKIDINLKPIDCLVRNCHQCKNGYWTVEAPEGFGKGK